MKTNDITKVTITKEDILILIEDYLNKNGYAPIEEIKINLGTEDISDSYSQYSILREVILPTVIECKKI